MACMVAERHWCAAYGLEPVGAMHWHQGASVNLEYDNLYLRKNASHFAVMREKTQTVRRVLAHHALASVRKKGYARYPPWS